MKFNSQLSYVDLSFNLLLVFICLFTIVFISIVEKRVKEEGIKLNTEYIVRYVWKSESNNDIDSYLKDPAGNIVFFQCRGNGLMALDRDDLGRLSDMYIGLDGNLIKVAHNEEIISIRGITPGEYTANVHFYRKSDKEGDTVTVILEKVNPHIVVHMAEVKLDEQGDEKTAFRFTITENGGVKNINNLQSKMIGN